MRALVRLGFVVALSACARGQATITTPPVEITSVSPPVIESIPGSEYFPANSVGTLRVDVAQAVATPYVQQIRERLNAAPVSPEFDRVRQAAFELADLVDVVTASIGPDPDRQGRVRVGVGLIEARFTLAQVADIMSRFDPDHEFRETLVGSFPAIDAGETTLIEIAPGRFLLGYTMEVAQLIRNPPRSDFMQQAELQRARSYVDQDAIITMASGAPTMGDTFDDAFEIPVASHMEALGFSLQATDAGLAIRAVALVDDPNAARSIAAKAREWRDQVLSTPSSALTNLMEVFRVMTIDSNGESATLETHLPENEVQSMIDTALSTFMAFAQPGGFGGATPVAPPPSAP